jgi:uncharacterized membrane protein (DUF106 family)
MLLDSIFGWALDMPLWAGILSLAAIVTALMNLVYALVTDQNEMRKLKAKMKDLQQEMKANRDNQKKAMQIQKKLLKANGQYSKKSLKPTLYTLIPIFIVFGWMTANLAFAPLMPGDEVQFSVEMQEPARLTLAGDILTSSNYTKETIEKQTSWRISADESTNFTVTNQDGELITRELTIGARNPVSITKHDAPFDESNIEYPKATPFGDFEIFGYKPGWLMTYIIFSIVLSIFIRKVFKLS